MARLPLSRVWIYQALRMSLFRRQSLRFRKDWIHRLGFAKRMNIGSAKLLSWTCNVSSCLVIGLQSLLYKQMLYLCLGYCTETIDREMQTDVQPEPHIIPIPVRIMIAYQIGMCDIIQSACSLYMYTSSAYSLWVISCVCRCRPVVFQCRRVLRIRHHHAWLASSHQELVQHFR